MAIKWDKRSVIAAFQAALAGQSAVPGKLELPNLAEKIKEVAEKNKGQEL